jgi:hypothetical protein
MRLEAMYCNLRKVDSVVSPRVGVISQRFPPIMHKGEILFFSWAKHLNASELGGSKRPSESRLSGARPSQAEVEKGTQPPRK